jgi:hypothetical protein
MAEPGVLDIPGYDVLGVLGQGGFGVVYRARQLAVGREVALKVDNRVLLDDRDRRRFMREVTAAGALSGHPHVAHVYDAGTLPDGRPYMVLELCPGGTLVDRLREEGRLGPGEVREIGVKIADALAAAHAEGVLHRDVKPANILINRYGMVALSDFGLAAMPTPGREMSVTLESLTPAFAPPEAFELGEPTSAGDVYSLAATLYALLSGRPPRFPRSGVVNLAAILALHRRPIPEIDDVPPELTAVLRAAMATNPHHRLPSASALRDTLSSLPLNNHPTPPNALRSGVSSGRSASRGGFSARGGPLGVPDGGSLGTVPPGRAGGGGRVTGPTLLPEPRRSRGQAKVFLSIAAVFAVLMAVGVGITVWERGPGAGTGAQSSSAPPSAATTAASARATTATAGAADSVGGVRTTTASCPAAAVAGANAACGVEAECWSGIVATVGSVTVNQVGCEQSHSWETFAVAPLPVNAITWNLTDLEKNPAVRRLCSLRVLLASRYARAKLVPAAKWSVTPLPPTKEAFGRGVRIYRCVGTVIGKEGPGTYFRPFT